MTLDDITTPAPQELIALPPSKRAAVALKSEMAEAHLRELVAKTAAITNVVDKNGREEAHRAAMGLKNARVAIKNIGEEAREDAVAFQRAVVAEVARLAAITADEETRLFALRDAYDAKMAAEKAERERIEAERVATIRNRVDAIKAMPVVHAAANSIELSAALANLAKVTVTAEEFAEFADEAAQAVDAAANALLTLRAAARQREEAEAERQCKAEADRIELARLKAEQAERDRVAAAEAAERARLAQVERDKAEADRKAAAAREAELQRQLAEMKAQMEAQQRAAQPQPDITVQDYERSANGSDASTTIDVPLVVEGQPVTMGMDLAAPGGDLTAEWIGDLPSMDELVPAATNTAPVRPDNGEIFDVLMTHFSASKMTVLVWLAELVKENSL